MTAYQPDKILFNLEAAIKEDGLSQPQPISGDKWLLSSSMQKAIRRGEVERAVRAAASLWYQDRLSFWRRLHIIAIEDIGVASTGVIIDVLTATASAIWRRKIGDLRVGLFLVRLLCQSVKTRIADELLLQAERSGSYNKLRQHFANASDDLLTDYVTDENCPLVERALAIWYLAGTKKFPSELMPQRKGSPDKVTGVLRSLAVPVELVESCIAVMGRTQYPLSIFTPLVWQEVQKQENLLKVRKNIIPASPDIEGLPFYSADVYTRAGQSCYRKLQKEVAELQGYSIRQIGVAQFYIEGGLLDKVITTQSIDGFSRDGEVADAEDAGLPLPDYLVLRECLQQNTQLLENIRQEQLHKYLNGAESHKVNVIQGKPTFTHSGIKGGA